MFIFYLLYICVVIFNNTNFNTGDDRNLRFSINRTTKLIIRALLLNKISSIEPEYVLLLFTKPGFIESVEDQGRNIFQMSLRGNYGDWIQDVAPPNGSNKYTYPHLDRFLHITNHTHLLIEGLFFLFLSFLMKIQI